jgi:flagellar hook protein FlgE
MGLYGVMTTSVSGMSAQADRMGTVADNIANVNTTGYKRSGMEFSTLVPEAQVFEYTPGSVQTHIRRNVSEQGGFSYTRSATDLAINGNGFFMVQNSTGAPFLTRAGGFVSNSDGQLVNAAGYKLLGYDLLNGDLSSIVNSAAGLTVVGTASLGLRAAASTSAKLQFNLPAGTSVVAPADLPSANAATATFSGKTSLVTYDNLGNEVMLDVYTAKTAANTWETSVYNHADAASAGGFSYVSGPLSSTSLTFDGTTGQFATGSATSLTVAVPNGASLNIDLTKSTQLAADYVVQGAEVNGNAPAKVSSLEVSHEGVVTAVYENGTRVNAYKIPLANVASPDNLNPVSGNVYSVSNTSGDLQIGIAGTASLGEVVSGALEKANVDLATELTTMVEAQRSYTANSKVFQTGAELLDVLVNLKR